MHGICESHEDVMSGDSLTSESECFDFCRNHLAASYMEYWECNGVDQETKASCDAHGCLWEPEEDNCEGCGYCNCQEKECVPAGFSWDKGYTCDCYDQCDLVAERTELEFTYHKCHEQVEYKDITCAHDCYSCEDFWNEACGITCGQDAADFINENICNDDDDDGDRRLLRGQAQKKARSLPKFLAEGK